MGLAVALLVFAGVWQLTEFLMSQSSADARRLVPIGALFVLVGGVIALGTDNMVTQIVAAAAALGGGAYIFIKRTSWDIRGWVRWALIVLDLLIAFVIVRQWK